MTKIILGTSKLGWDLSDANYKKQVKIIEFFLKKNFQLHISANYGYSLNRIRKIDSLKRSKSSFLLKISYKDQESFFHELIYTSMMIGIKKKIDIQIDEHFETKNLILFLKTLKIVKNMVNINNVLFTPISNNQNEFLKKRFNKFNFAVHYSLFERSVSNNFLSKNKKKKIIALRGFGRGLKNFSFSDFYIKQKKYSQKKLNKILLRFNINEIEARALYILHNKAFNKVVISTSNFKNLYQLLKLEKEKIKSKKWKLLENYSNNNFRFKKVTLPIQKNSFTKRHYSPLFLKSLNLLKKKKLISKKYFLLNIIYFKIGLINLLVNIFKIKIINLLK